MELPREISSSPHFCSVTDLRIAAVIQEASLPRTLWAR